ncbi:MAG TPA: sortase [Candidatus Saccharimonadales bacterium]|nr:sortase [Candidatus Saccharimonadales bacterium]
MNKFWLRPRTIITVLGTALLLGGAVSLTLTIRSRESNLVVTPAAATAAQAAPKPATQTSNYIGGTPVRIQIPSLNIDLAVIPGYYNAKSQTWTLTTDKVQYATITPKANNQAGNTFLYGHYRSNVFASLHRIQSGATAIITTDNGHKFTYTLGAVHVVSPSDSASVFNYQGPPILTVQTCTGLFFQNRQLFTFDLSGAA